MTRGPTPNRTVRRRHKESVREVIHVPGEPPVPPALPAETHSIARQWYESLKVSGQVEYFEASDWAAALLVAQELTVLLESQLAMLQNKGNPSMHAFSSIWEAMNDLLTTEASRRRARLLVERVKADAAVPAGVADLQKFRKKA